MQVLRRSTGVGRAHRAGVCLLLLWAFLAGSCAGHAKPRAAVTVSQWLVPLTMPHTDQLCVETTQPGLRPCISIGEFRAWMVAVQAD